MNTKNFSGRTVNESGSLGVLDDWRDEWTDDDWQEHEQLRHLKIDASTDTFWQQHEKELRTQVVRPMLNALRDGDLDHALGLLYCLQSESLASGPVGWHYRIKGAGNSTFFHQACRYIDRCNLLDVQDMLGLMVFSNSVELVDAHGKTPLDVLPDGWLSDVKEIMTCETPSSLIYGWKQLENLRLSMRVAPMPKETDVSFEKLIGWEFGEPPTESS